jgi:hypothetical protein
MIKVFEIHINKNLKSTFFVGSRESLARELANIFVRESTGREDVSEVRSWEDIHVELTETVLERQEQFGVLCKFVKAEREFCLVADSLEDAVRVAGQFKVIGAAYISISADEAATIKAQAPIKNSSNVNSYLAKF